MKKVKFGANYTAIISGYFQYDYGQNILVQGLGVERENLQFQFIQGDQQITVLSNYDSENEGYLVRIPDTFLQNSKEINCYVFYEDEEKGQTLKIIIIKITARDKFEDIPDPEHHGVLEQLLEMIANLQYQIDHFTISDEQLQEIIAEVEAGIDLNDYYNKEEVDDLLEAKANVSDIPDISNLATKAELANGLSGKVDNSELDNYYTKTQTNQIVDLLEAELDNKVDESEYQQNLNEIETALSGKAEESDLQSLAGTVALQGQDIENLQTEILGVNSVLDTILGE